MNIAHEGDTSSLGCLAIVGRLWLRYQSMSSSNQKLFMKL